MGTAHRPPCQRSESQLGRARVRRVHIGPELVRLHRCAARLVTALPPRLERVRLGWVERGSGGDGGKRSLTSHSSLGTNSCFLADFRHGPDRPPRDGSPSTGVDSGLIEIASQAPAPPQLATRLLAAFAVAKSNVAIIPNLAVSSSSRMSQTSAEHHRGLPSRSQFRQSSGCTIIPTCTKGTCLPATTMSDSSSSLAVSALEHDARDWSQSDSMRPHAQNLGPGT